jgi:S1-C subfamily serine protease
MLIFKWIYKMRQFLLLLVFLILVSCATASSLVQSGQVTPGMSKNSLRQLFLQTPISDDPFLTQSFRKYYSNSNEEIIAGSNKSMYYVFKDVTVPIQCGTWTCNNGNGRFVKVFYSLTDATNSLKANKAKSQTNTRIVKKNPVNRTPKKSASKGGASGSAFFVTQKGHIVTNHHVVKSCNTSPKIKYKNKDIDTKIIAKDQLLDLALLKADLSNTKYIVLSDEKPRKLQRIIASGYPFGEYISDDLKFTSGIVSSLKGPRDDSTLVQVDAALNPGNSGGPIVDEESGRLVAVSVMGMKKSISEGQNFGIKTNSVKSFLDANQIKTPSSWGIFKNVDVAKLLEDSTLYIYCR